VVDIGVRLFANFVMSLHVVELPKSINVFQFAGAALETSVQSIRQLLSSLNFRILFGQYILSIFIDVEPFSIQI